MIAVKNKKARVFSQKKSQIFLTCEHGGAEIPARYQKLFNKKSAVLKTHRAIDIGALAIAQFLKKDLRLPLLFSKTSRLIVDLNRILTNKTLFSEFTNGLSADEKNTILQKYYHPHRDAFLKAVIQAEEKDQLLIHIGVHSFTPELNGQKRKMQLALLYDPRRSTEKKFADLWIQSLKTQFPDYVIARNSPYKGAGYGINDFFRRTFSPNHYIGIEIEMAQSLLIDLQKNKQSKGFAKRLSSTLVEAHKNFKTTI